jgi:phosphate starvation-inducible PhoH-like protein
LPDTSPNVTASISPESREAAVSAAADRSLSAQTPPPVRTTITVPERVPMVGLLGTGDELLRLVEAEVDADVHVRGNEIAVTGQPADNAFAVAVFDELIALLGTGQQLRPDAVRRVIGMLRSGGSERPADVPEPEALRRRDRPAHDRLRHRPGRYRQDVPRHGEGRAGAADQAGQPDHPDPTRGRGR